VVTRRGARTRGASTLGCLFAALLFVVALYYGVGIGRVYWKYYKLIDEMSTSARFAQNTSDDDILHHLVGVAKDLDLPPEAQRFVVHRTANPPLVSIRTQYHAILELPFHNRVVLLKPHAEIRQ
jgi:hypothetical protein